MDRPGASSRSLCLITMAVRPEYTHLQDSGSPALVSAGRCRWNRASDGDRPVTSADVTTSTQPDETAQVSLHAQSGHLPPGSRTSLVDAVLDLPDVQDSRRLQATVPLGDTESLDRLRERTDDMNTHAPGSSVLVDADVHPAPDPALPEDTA